MIAGAFLRSVVVIVAAAFSAGEMVANAQVPPDTVGIVIEAKVTLGGSVHVKVVVDSAKVGEFQSVVFNCEYVDNGGGHVGSIIYDVPHHAFTAQADGTLLWGTDRSLNPVVTGGRCTLLGLRK